MITRRQFIRLAGGAAAAWPLSARAQQSGLPVVGFVSTSSLEMAGERPTVFRKGLSASGFTDGENVTVDYHWVDGRYEELPSLMADLIRRRVAVIGTAGGAANALAAKAATSTTPIVFAVGEDPVKLGLVASLARPGGNATGFNFFSLEANGKRLALLHELVPRAVHIAVLVNPANTISSESTLREVREAAPALGLQIEVFNASTGRDIEAAFARMHTRADALFVQADAFFDARRVQFATLMAKNGIPTMQTGRDEIEAGGLIGYGADVVDSYRQVGEYVGRILKGARPADLPVVQATKFELFINLQTARALNIEVPPTLLAIADKVIE
jgi:putative ABC transport system substrate-binding protein